MSHSAKMITLRPMCIDDLMRLNNINLDYWTEMYTTSFYTHYFTRWPELCVVAECADAETIAGYIIGKVEGEGMGYHSHISALSVAPEFRRAGVARQLVDYFEMLSEKLHDCYFADLYVRESNTIAIELYKARGYEVFRTVTAYYQGTPTQEEEDALDMRKPLCRDKERRCLEGAGKRVTPEDAI
ncbi:N(alpha)-acetyltransferase 20, NatB catalytic subunit [Perkinsus olseni]|uniref:N(Alpha)-acetyltransferase 20, NatB catalytic subunit n=1 Tax=Perkinsus olseni TaxID=32597 RepID=A0A7J6RF59_PEROL|nr:N(alpha)-acetyltransferase 20, NatB catalytic subunit [Perkinsus olseni]